MQFFGEFHSRLRSIGKLPIKRRPHALVGETEYGWRRPAVHTGDGEHEDGRENRYG